MRFINGFLVLVWCRCHKRLWYPLQFNTSLYIVRKIHYITLYNLCPIWYSLPLLYAIWLILYLRLFILLKWAISVYLAWTTQGIPPHKNYIRYQMSKQSDDIGIKHRIQHNRPNNALKRVKYSQLSIELFYHIPDDVKDHCLEYTWFVNPRVALKWYVVLIHHSLC